MSEANATSTRYVVICVDDEPEVLAALRRDLERICSPAVDVEACAGADQVLELVEELSPPEVRVPLVIADHVMPGMSGVDLLLALHDKPDYRATRKVLLSARTTLEDVTRALNQGALHRSLSKPWTPEVLRDCVRAMLTSYFIHHAPEEMGRFPDLVEMEQLPRAYQAAEAHRQTLDSQIATLKRSFLANMDMSDEEVEKAMVAGIDEALNNPPRRTYPAGSVLVREGEQVREVSIVVSGYVQLSRKAGEHEVILHTHTAGRIVGLLSLAHRQQAFLTCRAATEITVIPLSLKQVDTALQANPWLSVYFVTALIRSLGTRSKRMAQLKVEVEDLNGKLRGERDNLADAFTRLENAQMRLVESEKMATLGELVAGIAHELNNPVAAIQRAVEFIAEDVVSLVMNLPDGERVKAVLQSAITSPPLSTRELRARGAALAKLVGDEALTRRMVKVGVTTPEEYRAFFKRSQGAKRATLLVQIERYYELGASLRNLSTCSDRISELVQGLRSYVRPDHNPVDNVDIHEGLEDTLRILGHALRDVQVERSYGELPTVECRPGELNQVWTNLISNALQAMGDKGKLRIATDAPGPKHVRVRVIDSGKGIAPDVLGRVFDLHFTTKDGRVKFGLGMGLPICRQIVSKHGGTLTAESKPGETCFTVVLPVRFPRTLEDEADS